MRFLSLRGAMLCAHLGAIAGLSFGGHRARKNARPTTNTQLEMVPHRSGDPFRTTKQKRKTISGPLSSMAVSMPVTPYLAQASRAPRPEGLPFADWAAQWPVWSWLARFVRVWPSIVLRMPFLFSTPALEQDLEIDHASLRMLQDARAAAREAMISAAAAEAQALTRAAERATARAQHVQEYYKTWAAAVLKEQANKKSTGAQGVAGASPPPTAVTVPRAMDLAASIAARDRVRDLVSTGQAPQNSSALDSAHGKFVGLWNFEHEDGTMDMVRAQGGCVTSLAEVRAGRKSRVHRWISVASDLHFQEEMPNEAGAKVKGEAETPGTSTNGATSPSRSSSSESRQPLPSTDCGELETLVWWEPNLEADQGASHALVSAKLRRLSRSDGESVSPNLRSSRGREEEEVRVVEVTRRYVQESRRNVLERMVVETSYFGDEANPARSDNDEDTEEPIACTRALYRRVVASDIFDSIRWQAQQRRSRRAAEQGIEDAIESELDSASPVLLPVPVSVPTMTPTFQRA